ncbi:MAG: dTDP-4-amino-4,6-dideoxygalactose transaminase [Anaerolineae bacterium]|nr:dTDP-4-amino-4,6-dideoxygalactose transaminase [Anaerolineae bacterium]
MASFENYTIPYNRPSMAGNEQHYIAQVIENRHAAGDGAFTRKCHALLQEILGAPRALLTTSCTHALEMTALLLDIQPGDEVVMPSFTFVSTVNAFVLRGARPVFADIRPDTLNIDETQLEHLITPRTRAILVVHYAGVGCEMDAILNLAERHQIAVIEDNAHGLFGQYRGKMLGTFGSLATQSFHETKNITCGEGGALIINDPQYIERAEIIREKGTNRSQFFRGQVDKYTWVDVGSSYLPSDILAAFLYAQLEARATIQANRKHSWTRYHAELADWAAACDVRLPIVPDYCEQPYHIYYLLLPNVERRQALIEHLKAHGILSVFHYQPLHLSVMGQRYGGQPGDCPVTERISDQLLRLPLFNNFTDAEQSRVIEALHAFEG